MERKRKEGWKGEQEVCDGERVRDSATKLLPKLGALRDRKKSGHTGEWVSLPAHEEEEEEEDPAWYIKNIYFRLKAVPRRGEAGVVWPD